MKKNILILLFVCLFCICGCSKNEQKIVGEWKLSTNDYFEFFEDGTFERTCTNYLCSMIIEDEDIQYDNCIIKGTYELKNKTSLYLYPSYSNCELEDEVFIYGFDSKFTYFCANAGALCMGGWQKTFDTPFHLNDDGSRIK